MPCPTMPCPEMPCRKIRRLSDMAHTHGSIGAVIFGDGAPPLSAQFRARGVDYKPGTETLIDHLGEAIGCLCLHGVATPVQAREMMTALVFSARALSLDPSPDRCWECLL